MCDDVGGRELRGPDIGWMEMAGVAGGIDRVVCRER
jgi:hypothetical protein